MKKLGIIIGVIVVVGLVVVFILTQPKKESSVIKIGHIAPLTGDAAIWGQWAKEGIELGVDEINSKGGVKGKKIIVIHEDDQGKPDMGVNAINKLIKVDKVQAIIGGITSGVTLACAPIAEQNRVVLLSHGAAANKISYAGDYIFRIFPSNSQEAQRLVEIARKLKIKKAAILFINNDFGSELADVVKKIFEEGGGNILVTEGYEPEVTDFRTSLTKLKNARPQAVFLLGYPKDMSLILKQSKEIGLNEQFLAPDTFDAPEILQWAGEAAEGVIFVYPALPQTDRLKKFSEALKRKFGKEPNMLNAMGYDAIRLLALAIEEGGEKGEQIKEALYKIKNFPGVTGDITFDKNGDVIYRPIGVKTVKGGKFVEYPMENTQ
jgi:branched-chain amino acid transport system substrate-binding protein